MGKETEAQGHLPSLWLSLDWSLGLRCRGRAREDWLYPVICLFTRARDRAEPEPQQAVNNKVFNQILLSDVVIYIPTVLPNPRQL